MKITTYGHVHQLAFLPRLFPFNCYLVEEGQELTLVDAAMPYCTGAILRAAASLGKPITRIVLTHAHEDHVGALDRLKDQLPQAQVLISRRDARLLTGDVGLEPGEPQQPIRGGVPKGLRTRPDRLLDEGDTVGSLRAVAAPGHTPGHMAFLDERNKMLIAGDAFQTRGGIAVSGKLQPLFPFPALATWSKELSIESARKLVALKPSCLAVGHGELLVSPVGAMERAIVQAEDSLAKKGAS